MKDYEVCFGCGAPIRRGFRMVTAKGNDVIICGNCMRLWKKHKEKEAEAMMKGADGE